MSSIIVPLDGSRLSERALPYAEHLAKALPARLVLTRILPVCLMEPAEDDLDLAECARAYLQTHAERLAASGIQTATLSLRGAPAEMIIDQVRSVGADLIIMGTHGCSGPGQWVYGRVAGEVLERSSVPVILVPPACATQWLVDQPLRILVSLDGSRASETGLVAAEALARRLDSELVLLRVVQWPPSDLYTYASSFLAAFNPEEAINDALHYLSTLAAQMTLQRIRVVTELGEPAAAIAKVAHREKADLIAMGPHSQRRATQIRVGNVTTGTLYHAHLPVMLVPPNPLEAGMAQATAQAVAR